MSENKYEGITIQNSLGAGAKNVFEIRKTYDEVFPTIVGVYDFNKKDNLLYGRVDLDGDTVHANEYYLKPVITSRNEEILCMNFVADAYEDFRYSIKTQYVNRLKIDEFFTTDWEAERAWESPHSFYDKRVSDINQVFIKGNLFFKNNKDSVKNMDDFLKIFFNDFYLSTNGTLPLTKSGVLCSKFYNPSSTGMCIEISRDSTELESVKFDKFIKSPNFEFYLLTAAKHGFIVDKNAPWRLIANLSSPQMHKYMALYNLDNSNVFETCFVKTHLYDIANLKVYMRQMYDYFLSISPNYTEKQPVFDNQKCPADQQLDKIIVKREPFNMDDYNLKYNDIFWLKLYYRLKLTEKNIQQSTSLLSGEIKRIQQIYNSLDFDQTLDYINKRIKLQTS
tara:strand:- start:61 stop:1239 length:1179 start_codon:yes stop_codon:yes gene_type:complete